MRKADHSLKNIFDFFNVYQVGLLVLISVHKFSFFQSVVLVLNLFSVGRLAEHVRGIRFLHSIRSLCSFHRVAFDVEIGSTVVRHYMADGPFPADTVRWNRVQVEGG